MADSNTADLGDADRSLDDVVELLAGLADPNLADAERARTAREALALIPHVGLLVDLDGTVLDCNERAAELGVSRQDLLGRALWRSPWWSAAAEARNLLAPLVDDAMHGRFGTRTMDIRDGDTVRPTRVSVTPIIDSATFSTPAMLLVDVRDLADRRHAEAIIEATSQALAEAESIFRAITEHTSDLVCLHEPDGTFTYISPSIRTLLDLDPNDLLGTPPADILHASTRSTLTAAIAKTTLPDAEPTRVTLQFRHQNGSHRWLEMALTPIFDQDGTVRQLQSSSRDITEQKRTERDLIRLAFHDELTGLPNRALLLDRIEQALAVSRRTGRPIGVLFIDLDGFKLVNDTIGHHAGDTALLSVGERLRAIVRPGDTLARFGGDEFVMLCAGDDGATGAKVVAERILGAMAEPFHLAGTEVSIGASIGIATSADIDDPLRLVKNADAAMYNAKHGGRGRIAVYDQSAEPSSSIIDLVTETALHDAVSHQELRLVYQPEIDLESGAIVGFEALVRWRRDNGEVVNPADFIPQAERSGAIIEIERWVIAEACSQAQRWSDRRTPQGHPIRISVNLSARHLRDPDLVDYLAQQIEQAEISSSTICLEITESALVDDSLGAIAQLDRLGQLGVSLGIDDFGTGFSQFSSLQRLPVDVLKVDRSFVAALGRDSSSAKIVAAIIQVAHALGWTVVAEGVENQDQLDVLRTLDCDGALGYLFSEPLEAAAFEAALASVAVSG